jgi:sRNA-binding carbon storage regulator CsrA
VTGDKVRLGIQAPRDVSVFRKEVLIAIGLDGDGNLAIEDVTKTDFEAA